MPGIRPISWKQFEKFLFLWGVVSPENEVTIEFIGEMI